MGSGRVQRRLAAALLCVLGWLGALLAPVAAQEYAFRSYTQEDGLANLSITALAQDAMGFLWVGTENGLYRFDGGKFQRFGPAEGLKEPYVSAIHVTPSGVLWVGTTGGLYRWDGRTFAPVSQDGRPVPVWQGQKLASLDAGHLLVVGREDLLVVEAHRTDAAPGATTAVAWVARPYFTPDQKAAQPALNRIQSVRVFGVGEQGGGDIWLGCGQALCEVRQGQLKLWGPDQGVAPDRWGNVLRDVDGTLWARGEHQVLALAPADAQGEGGRFMAQLPLPSTRTNVRVFLPLLQDMDRNIVTFGDQGLLRLAHPGKGQAPSRWEQLGDGNGLPAREVSALLVDHDGDLWVGSAGLGLTHWVGYRSWANWTARQGLIHESVWSFRRDGAGRLVIGTDGGLARLEEGGDTPPHIIPAPGGQPVLNHQVGSLALDKSGRLWGGTFSGLLFYQDPGKDGAPPAAVVVAHLPLIFQVFIDAQGRLWVMTRKKGLYVIDKPEGPNPQAVPLGAALPIPPDTSVSSACQAPSGTLWFATETGVLRFGEGKWTAPAITGVPPVTRFNVIACARDGSLWLGGETVRLAHVQEPPDNAPGAGTGVLQPVGDVTEDLVGDRQVLGLLEDRRGWMWLATDSGVLVWNAGALRQYSHDTGLVWNDCNQSALIEDDDGTLWVGTSKGLTHITRPDLLFNRPALVTRVTGIERNGMALPTDGNFELPWDTAPLTFHLTTPSFRSRGGQIYRYRLNGLESDWNVTAAEEIRYSALPSGTYELELVARNTALQAMAPAILVPFSIRPPWWQTKLFFAGCALSVVAIGVAIYRWRTHADMQRRRTLEILVEARTRELEASREQLRQLAMYDSLTHLWNRRAILDLLELELARRREDASLTVVLADVDHFKRINDTHGHPAGDAVLVEVSRRLSAAVRSYDAVGRYGGEEFLILLPGLGREDCGEVLNRLHGAISLSPIALGDVPAGMVQAHEEGWPEAAPDVHVDAFGVSVTVTCSFGVISVGPKSSHGPTGVPPLEEIIKRADQALYRAKHLGRNRVEYATGT
ncbi:ligand-binding sensor domain-containing diguanylate cyclase [Nitrospirillum viridazoti]|uniref:ligand-binding sensor domain-containing diguanylate cyclase n=1 Tax=Nitrospirillum viridazoti TaxID=3144925 RepID=UPI0011ABA343|nr:ligand-binding sensor domain-containing diguanylate cyclase [Nitrospirillum amazonense]TWB40069.1 diguanylate cyclase (GGDEF)-like protein [Nitrospirillum amazonense]